tara:strand:+ start:1335 stop:2891 length:1557 start_codon:yes stop_codon:yes gene_type:complete
VNTELVIRSAKESIDIVVLKEGRLIELHQLPLDQNICSVFDIYLAKVKKVASSLNAAFVDIGQEKDAFLHYHDLGPFFNSANSFIHDSINKKGTRWNNLKPNFKESLPKDGLIEDILKKDDTILVQVSKEPISTKGPRIVSEISLAGRFLVLVPFSNRISVSQKIKDEKEKKRLARLMKSLVPEGFGVVVRTVAKNKKVVDLDTDLRNLIRRWIDIHRKLKGAKPPSRISVERSKVLSLLRDVLNESFTKIIVDKKSVYDDVKMYLQKFVPEKEDILALHKLRKPLFDIYNVDKQIKTAFGKTVSMKKGTYLVIEHTEAMHVIDVNSGNRTNKHETQEENALEVNLQAAAEVARQLRLRDMGGIIVVDFIDMHIAENRKMLTDTLREHMREDRAKHKILAPSRFGLIEITRQRVRPQITIKTRESCPSCNGSGEIEAPIVFVEQLKDKLDMLAQKKAVKEITLVAHPFVIAYLKKGFPSFQFKWSLKNRIFLYLRENHSFSFLEYSFINSKGQRIIFS